MGERYINTSRNRNVYNCGKHTIIDLQLAILYLSQSQRASSLGDQPEKIINPGYTVNPHKYFLLQICSWSFYNKNLKKNSINKGDD